MIVREIVVSCSNPHVARAAIASIGGDFARRFSEDAAERNLSSGLLASRLVRHFVSHARDGDWEGVGEATQGADMPVLTGLRYILERGLAFGEGGREDSGSETLPWRPWMASLGCSDAWRNCA
jgi:hypothetical protein